VEGIVVAVDPPPPEPFPDRFTIAYAEITGEPHQVIFERNDLYSTPKLGEKVDVRYLPEAPDKPLGPARWGDIAFEEYVPWAIGIVVGYFVLQLTVGLFSLVTHRARTTAAT
jgi:hypothetical protein